MNGHHITERVSDQLLEKFKSVVIEASKAAIIDLIEDTLRSAIEEGKKADHIIDILLYQI